MQEAKKGAVQGEGFARRWGVGAPEERVYESCKSDRKRGRGSGRMTKKVRKETRMQSKRGGEKERKEREREGEGENPKGGHGRTERTSEKKRSCEGEEETNDKERASEKGESERRHKEVTEQKSQSEGCNDCGSVRRGRDGSRWVWVHDAKRDPRRPELKADESQEEGVR